MVPTVERGDRVVVFCSIAIEGERPSTESTSGRSIWSRNCRAYADSDSTYRRCPSAYRVSKASEDLPDPDSPVTTVSEFRGISRSMFFRLCCRAPRTTIFLRLIGSRAVRQVYAGRQKNSRAVQLSSVARPSQWVKRLSHPHDCDGDESASNVEK